MTIEELLDDLDARLRRAVVELEGMKVKEYSASLDMQDPAEIGRVPIGDRMTRLNGKIEGVRLAIDYLRAYR